MMPWATPLLLPAAAPALRRSCASPRSLGTLRSPGLGCSPALRMTAATAAPPPSVRRLLPMQAALPWGWPDSHKSISQEVG